MDDFVVEIIQGDITEIKNVEAIVNAANNRFWMGGGVAGAIKRKGGIEIEKEAVKQGPKPVGEVVVTKAGKLPYKYVIHAAVMEQDLVTTKEFIKKATSNTLKKSEELKVESVAFPAFGTGIGGFPFDECARIMLSEVYKFSKKSRNLKKVVFVLFSFEIFDIFKKIYKEIFIKRS